MQIVFVTNDSVNSFWANGLSKTEKADVIVFGFNGLGLVSYKKELNGETEYFSDLAKMSKETSSVIISGCDTDSYGVFRHSAVIADKGRLLGVSDMAHSIDESEFLSGGGFRVYDTSKGKIGIIILEDLYFPESARVLTLCDADIIICIFKKIDSFMPQVLLRSSAFSNGVVMGLVAKKYSIVCDIRGNVKYASNSDISKVKINIEKDYRLVSSRRRGLYREFNSGY